MMEGVYMTTPVPLWLCDPKTGPPTSCSLQDTHCTAKEGWIVDCHTLLGSVQAEEIPSPERFPGELWLLRSEKGRNSCPGHGSSQLCCPIWNAPSSAMWSDAGALPMSCPPPWGKCSPELGGVGCCRKEPHGSCSCICSHLPYPRSWRGRTGCRDTWWVLHLKARGGCPFGGRIRPHMRQISSITTGICPLTGKSNPCRFGEGYTPRSATRSPLSEVTAGNYLPWLSSWGGALWVPIPGHNPGIITTAPVWTLQTIWLPPRIQELWVNTMLFLSLTSNSTASWSPEKWLEMHWSSPRIE